MKNFILSILVLTGVASSALAAEPPKPLVREGVKWVYYERHYGDGHNGDFDDQRFYTIEMRGDTVICGKRYKKVYRTADKSLMYGMTCDSVTPYSCLREYHGTVMATNVEYYDSEFFYELEVQMYEYEMKHNTLDGFEYILYNFVEGQDHSPVGVTYIAGEPCRVYSSTDGFGSYRVVESVGLDHDSEGDLLCLYMLPCDCLSRTVRGLHHMEDADGAVIYKGAAYYADGRLRGDLDGNGAVDVNDLNASVNRLLTPESIDVTADLTGEGLVDIDDVNRLVNIMLRQ